jgi:hypothetical protein
VLFDVAYRWVIADEWCLGYDWQSCIKVVEVRVDDLVTEPFLLPFANQIHEPSQRSFGKSFSLSAFTLPNIPARISGICGLLYPYVG